MESGSLENLGISRGCASHMIYNPASRCLSFSSAVDAKDNCCD